MLVLSRRVGEEIVIPHLGITIQYLGAKGSAAKIGLSAPPDVSIVRGELAGQPRRAPEPQPSLSHELCNRLNKLALMLHIYRKQLESNQPVQAQATLDRAVALLGELDRDFVKEQTRPAAPRALRSLIVDDDANERELLAGVLEMNGCDCRTAADGLDALDYLAANERPDFVLLDMWMPRCDGPQTLARIRRDGRLKDLKVFAVSGASPLELGIKPGPDGLDGWFSKPLNPAALWDGIQASLVGPASRN